MDILGILKMLQDFINKQLKTKYGCNIFGQQFYRVVFSDDLQEKRFGVFNEFYGKIFIREFRGLKEVPKYSYLKHRYVLEKWAPATLAYDSAIPETSQGSYEPIYVFQDAQGNALTPLFQVAERIIWHLEHPNLPGHTKSLMETEEELQKEREIQNSLDQMEEASPYLAGKLHGHEAVTVPESYDRVNSI